MQVDVITSFGRTGPLGRNWEAVYAADPEAQFFLSWTWIWHYLHAFKGVWLVLAAKPRGASDYVAFLPLKVRTELTKERGFHNEIGMACNFGTYTGLICAPGFEREAIPALAKFLKHHFHWAKLRFENLLLSEERLRLFTNEFAESRFAEEPLPRIDNGDNVDQYVCPYAALPESWDEYLDTRVSANTRQKMKRFLKRIDSSDEFRITLPEPATLERDIDILLQFWERKWGPYKGRRLPGILKTHRILFTRCFAEKTLYLPVLWRGERPIGALGNVIDRQKRSMLFIMGARDESFNNPPPGFLLHTYSIRSAIGAGLKSYDFLNGNEPYKYAFGVEERHLKHFAIVTRNRRNLGDQLDAGTIPIVLQEIARLFESRRFAEAERGCRQILAVNGKHSGALSRLAEALQKQERYGAAKRTLKELVAIDPKRVEAWDRLGRVLERLGDTTGAIASFRKVLELVPDDRDAAARLAALASADVSASPAPAPLPRRATEANDIELSRAS